jgi:hypothetical protein
MSDLHIWDLQSEAELKSMVEGLLKIGHHLAAYQLGSSTQCGWRNRRFPSVPDVWGMPLSSRIEALRDATSRFFQSIKNGRAGVFSHPAPTLSSLAKPLTPFPTALDAQPQ